MINLSGIRSLRSGLVGGVRANDCLGYAITVLLTRPSRVHHLFTLKAVLTLNSIYSRVCQTSYLIPDLIYLSPLSPISSFRPGA